MGGNDDHRQLDALLRQGGLQGEAVHAGQAHVGDETAGSVGIDGRQVVLGGAEGLDPVTFEVEQQTQGIPDGRVVVHHIDGGGVGRNAQIHGAPFTGSGFTE